MNDGERPSLGARILRAPPTRLVIELAAVGLAPMLARPLGALPPAARRVAWPVATAALAAMAYVLVVRALEKRRASELAGPRALPELAAGLAIGAALFAVTIGAIAALGGYAVTGVHSAWDLVPPLGMALVAGVFEELIARGVVFRVLEEWLGTWAALAISSLLFGAAHLGNPNATWWSALAIAIEAGTLLGAAYMTTRRLWLAIGLHAAWNWTQGAVFGVAVSGNAMRGLLAGEMRGPAWLSGGEFGAEASVVAVVTCTSAAALLLRYALKKRPPLAPSWRRRA